MKYKNFNLICIIGIIGCSVFSSYYKKDKSSIIKFNTGYHCEYEENNKVNYNLTKRYLSDSVSLSIVKNTENRIHPELIYKYYTSSYFEFSWWFHKDDFNDIDGWDSRLYQRPSEDGCYSATRGTIIFDPLVNPNLDKSSRGIILELDLIPGQYYWDIWWKKNNKIISRRMEFIVYE